jgi:hypothetical protein
MAGFQVILSGRFWVIAEDLEAFRNIVLVLIVIAALVYVGTGCG